MTVDESVEKYLVENNLLPDGEHRLFIGVKGGGCSGMQYVFQIVRYIKDAHIEVDARVITDKKSLLFLRGCKLVYKQTVGASVLVVENPNAVSTCGCGESFSI